MRNTQKVSVWPVGLVGGLRYESPIVIKGMVSLAGDVEFGAKHTENIEQARCCLSQPCSFAMLWCSCLAWLGLSGSARLVLAWLGLALPCLIGLGRLGLAWVGLGTGCCIYICDLNQMRVRS